MAAELDWGQGIEGFLLGSILGLYSLGSGELWKDLR